MKITIKDIFQFCDYIFNERKLKLKYDGEWFEFYVKNISENKQFKSIMYQYQCEDAFIDELSRNGYGITFDTELYNNVEEIGVFTEQILEDSIWEYDASKNWGDFTEYAEEKLFKIPVSMFDKIVGYKINYDVEGNANFNSQRIELLQEQNITKFGNPETYTIKHTLSDYERNSYVEYLRESDPEKYVNSKDAEKNISDALEFYSNEQQKGTIKLNSLSISGWTFIGWFDEEGNEVTELNRLSPKEITLIAKWEQN